MKYLVKQRNLSQQFLFFVLAFLTLGVTRGASAANGVPADAVLLDAESHKEVGGNIREACLRTVEQHMNFRMDHLRYLMKVESRQDEEKARKKLEFECGHVFFVWSPMRMESSSYCLFGCRQGKASVQVEYYCQPRNLKQREILSLQRACEEEPKPECYTKDFLDYLDQFEPTVYTDLNQPVCPAK